MVLISLRLSSDLALDASATIAGITILGLSGRVSCVKSGKIILSNREGDDQYAGISKDEIRIYNLGPDRAKSFSEDYL